MTGKVLKALALALLLALGAAAQDGGYVDIYMVKVKPEKNADFENVVKKMVDANRKNNGDTWITSQTIYGEHGNVYFWSLRSKYGEIDKGMSAFEGAIAKAFGPAGMGKLFGEFSQCISAGRGEIRRIRPDLGRNVPSDPAAMNRLVAESKVYRSTIYRVRPGRLAEFESLLRDIKAAYQKNDVQDIILVSQSNVGQQGQVFYTTQFKKDLGGFDTPAVSTQRLLGPDGYKKYTQTVQNAILGTETIINRMNPALSNAPAEIAAAAPDVWNPKPAAAAPAKAKKAEAAKTD